MWVYVEVKTLSGGKFYVTKNEIEFSQSHKGLYEVFLVGSEIYTIVDVDYKNKEMFRLEGQDFLVSYKLI